MRRLLMLGLVILTACGGREVPPPDSVRDGATNWPVADAGTGDCADDFHATRILCNGQEGEAYRACVLAADDRFEGCLPPHEECSIRCTDTFGVVGQEADDCRAACPD